jgi:hypothetical protein
MQVYPANIPTSLVHPILFLRNQLLHLKRGHTPAARTRNRLPIPLILHVAGGEHALHARLRRPGHRDDVPLCVCLDLWPHKRGRGLVPDGVEEPRDGQCGGFVGEHVFEEDA